MAPNLHLAVNLTGGVVNGNGNNKKKRRKLIIWGSVVTGVVLLIAVGVFAATRGGTKIDPSKLAKVEKGDLAKSVVATGKVTPITKVEVKSKASGIVKKLLVDYGDRVKKGQLLAQLDKIEIEAQVAQSRAGSGSGGGEPEELAGRLRARQGRCGRSGRAGVEARLRPRDRHGEGWSGFGFGAG